MSICCRYRPDKLRHDTASPVFVDCRQYGIYSLCKLQSTDDTVSAGTLVSRRYIDTYYTLLCVQGQTGSVSVNDNGERNQNYAVYDFVNNSFQQVAQYNGFTHNYSQQHAVGGATV